MNLGKNCNIETTQNHCPHCGTPKSLNRIDRKYIATEIGSVFNLQKGLFFTIKELAVRPGKSIETFILEDRTRLVKPIMFILICSLTYAISEEFFEFKHKYINLQFDSSDTAISLISEWITQNYGYSNILMSVFVVIWIKILYRKYDYNFYEVLIMLFFITGMQMLMATILGVLESLTKVPILRFGSPIVLIYVFWATAQFFDKRKILNYLKAPVSYVLGMITFFLVALGIGVLIELII